MAALKTNQEQKAKDIEKEFLAFLEKEGWDHMEEFPDMEEISVGAEECGEIIKTGEGHFDHIQEDLEFPPSIGEVETKNSEYTELKTAWGHPAYFRDIYQ
jgi:hypothetical protein